MCMLVREYMCVNVSKRIFDLGYWAYYLSNNYRIIKLPHD